MDLAVGLSCFVQFRKFETTNVENHALIKNSMYLTTGLIECGKIGYILNPHTQTCTGIYESGMDMFEAKTHCEDMFEHLQTLPTQVDAQWLQYQL